MAGSKSNKKIDFGKSYEEIHNFLSDATYEDMQSEEYSEQFYYYFHFTLQTETEFKFIKKCFRSPKKPADFDIKFTPILNIIVNSDFIQIIDKYYKTFNKILFGNNKDDNQNQNNGDNNEGDNGSNDDSNSNNSEVDIDFESSYEEIHELFKGRTFDDYKQNKKLQKYFYQYFHFEVRTESVYKFIKFCFRNTKAPKGFNKRFTPVIKKIVKKKPKEIPVNYYEKFMTGSKSNKKIEFGKNYQEIHNFLSDATYEDMQSEEYSEQFYYYFHFTLQTETEFEFIKKCFRSPKKPADFDTKYTSILNIIVNSDFVQIVDKYYKTFNKILFGNNKDENENQNNGDQNKGNDKNKNEDKNKGNNNGENEEGNKGNDKGNNKDTNQRNDMNYYNENYQQIYEFLSDLTFEDTQKTEISERFYSLFNFNVESESQFNFVKECFKTSEQPNNFGLQFSVILNVILNSNMVEIPDEYFTIFTNNLSINKNGYQFVLVSDYQSYYSFLINLSFAELQTKENFEKFYSYFKFYPVSESMLEFIQYCFQYPDEPANLEINFKTVINMIFQSNFEITIDFYTQFAKYLFGDSQLYYVNNYEAVYTFLKDLVFENTQSGDNWDTFYYYFQCYPTTESIFNFIKYCYQYEQKPTNFDGNFWYVLKTGIFDSTSNDISADLYTTFDKNLFGNDNNNNQQDFGANYGTIYKFLTDLTFEDVQTNENSQKFYRFFGFYPTSDGVFEFIKYCFQYPEKPANFEVNFEKCFKEIQTSGTDEITTHYYTEFAKNLFGPQNQFYKGKYDEVHKFLKDAKFEDMETSENWDLFYYYFECYPVSASLFQFMKFCFSYEVAPVNFETNFQNCLNKIYTSESDEVESDLYIMYIKNLFNGNIYKAVHNFTMNLSFEQVQQSAFKEVFHYYFQFYPQSENLFNFMKNCFQYNTKPVNFDKNFQAALGSYLESGDDQVTESIKKIFSDNLFGDKGEEQQESYNFGFNKMFDNDNGGGYDNGYSQSNDNQGGNYGGNQGGYDNGNSWSYTWTNGNQDGSYGGNQGDYNEGNNGGNGYNNGNSWSYSTTNGNQDGNNGGNQGEQGGYNNGGNGYDNGNSWSYSWTSDNQDGSNGGYNNGNENQGGSYGDNQGDNSNNGQHYEYTYHYD